MTALFRPLRRDYCRVTAGTAHLPNPDRFATLRERLAAYSDTLADALGDAVGPWVARACAAYASREIAAAILLVAARTETAWFAPLFDHTICFVRQRLRFIPGPGVREEGGARFPSALVYLGPAVARFAPTCAPLGPVLRRVGAA